MSEQIVLDVKEDPSIKRHQIANRLTGVERRLAKLFAKNSLLIICVGNIGVGKSSLVKLLACSTGMNALFELPDEGFEDYIIQNESIFPLLATAKDAAKRTLGRYYSAINDFIKCDLSHPRGSPEWNAALKNVQSAALDIQHAYLDLRKMQLQAVPTLAHSTCIDGSVFADRYAFCEVLHNDMDVPYLAKEALDIIDTRLKSEFSDLKRPDLVILLHGPIEYLFQNITERDRPEEKDASGDNIPEGLSRLVRALNKRYDKFVDVLRETNWYRGPVLKIDVSKIDFVSNVRHLIVVYEGIEALLSGDKNPKSI
jgi:deoxyadenosine/deoxycytidine kinase